MAYAFTNHDEVLTGGVSALNARAVATSILGNTRGCVDQLASTFKAPVAASQDALARTSDTVTAEAVPGLSAAHGRCYRETTQPRSVQLLRASQPQA